MVAVAAALASLAIRAPFVSTFPINWDSVLYLRAIEHFAPAMDPRVGQPHPPGYIFYVLSARMLAELLEDPYAGLVAMSLLGAALACAAGVIVGSLLGNRAAGILCGALLIANPLLSFYSEIGYPYTLLAAFFAVVAGLGFWALRGRPLRLAVAALALGVLSGFRQDLLLLGPFGLYVSSRAGPKGVLLATGALTLGTLTWIIPSGLATGGIDRFFAMTATQFFFSAAPTGGQSFRENLVLAILGVGGQIRWLLPFVVIGGWVVLRKRRHLVPFLLWWSVPPMLFYLVAHIGEFGYALSIAAPLALLSAFGILGLLEAWRRGRGVIVAAVALAVLLNSATFAVDQGRFSLDRIRQTETDVIDRIALVHERFEPRESVILAEFWFMHALEYLPEHRVEFVPVGVRVTNETVLPADSPRIVVLFDRELVLAEPDRAIRLAAGSGAYIRWLRLAQGERIARVGAALVIER